jgi:hypothetical protein
MASGCVSQRRYVPEAGHLKAHASREYEPAPILEFTLYSALQHIKNMASITPMTHSQYAKGVNAEIDEGT